jgi:hypothetical protein
VAGNQLGKDFVAAFIAVVAFLICLGRKITCRIVTTSVAEHHLKVLWGEISRFITTSRRPLVYDSLKNPFGILLVNYQEVRRTEERAAKNPLNYLVGRVSQKGEGLAGHHAEFTMFVGDEASGLDDAIVRRDRRPPIQRVLRKWRPPASFVAAREGVTIGECCARTPTCTKWSLSPELNPVAQVARGSPIRSKSGRRRWPHE